MENIRSRRDVGRIMPRVKEKLLRTTDLTDLRQGWRFAMKLDSVLIPWRANSFLVDPLRSNCAKTLAGSKTFLADSQLRAPVALERRTRWCPALSRTPVRALPGSVVPRVTQQSLPCAPRYSVDESLNNGVICPEGRAAPGSFRDAPMRISLQAEAIELNQATNAVRNFILVRRHRRLIGHRDPGGGAG